jgi:integrase
LGDYALMMWIGALTGLRWGEVAGLRVGSVDLLLRELAVVEQRTRDLEDDDVTGTPKSAAGRRSLRVDPALADMISEHLAGRRLTGADGDAFFFVRDMAGKPLNYSHWRQRVSNPRL